MPYRYSNIPACMIRHIHCGTQVMNWLWLLSDDNPNTSTVGSRPEFIGGHRAPGNALVKVFDFRPESFINIPLFSPQVSKLHLSVCYICSYFLPVRCMVFIL